MKTTETTTQAEIRILTSIHLRGTMGKCGSMTKEQRLDMLFGLINKGLLKDNMSLTAKGIELCRPSYVTCKIS